MTAEAPTAARRSRAVAYLADLKVEALRILRMPELFAPVILMPVAFYLLLGVAMRAMRAHSSNPAMSDITVFVSFAIYGAVAVGLINVASMMATDRALGLTTLRRALPAPPASYLLAKIALAMGFSLAVTGAIMALAVTLGGVDLPPWRLGAIGVLMVLGIAPGCAIGLCVAAHASASATTAICTTIFLGMMMLGGLFYPLPGLLDRMRPIWPSYHLQQLALSAAGLPSEGSALAHLAVLSLVTAAFGWLTARRLARAD